jgi:DNA-binding Lrp family transcriptional regulator
MLKNILKILENDARITPQQIATMTGASLEEVNKQISQAEKDRVILKYKTVVNWDRLEEDEQVWAIIEVKVKPDSLYLASGNYDLLLVVVGKTEHQVADFVAQNLAHLEGVQGTVTHFILKRYKDDGEILEGGQGVKRQPVIL